MENQVSTSEKKKKSSGAMTHNKATNLHVLSFKEIC